MHRTHSLKLSRVSISRSDFYYINGSITRTPNDSALETSRLVIMQTQEAPVSTYYLMFQPHNLPVPWFPHLQKKR